MLPASQLFCLICLLLSPSRRLYRISAVYLTVAIIATVTFQSDISWLHRWYICLDTPAVILRFAAALECLHRQTERYPEWWLLMGSVFLIGSAAQQFAYVTPHGSTLEQFVEMRRNLHIWMASICLVTQLFWMLWADVKDEHRDATARIFTVLCVSHAVVGLYAMRWGFQDKEGWNTIRLAASWIDAGCYVFMATVFLLDLNAARSRQHRPEAAKPLYRGAGSE
jgi:hypothetical protein